MNNLTQPEPGYSRPTLVVVCRPLSALNLDPQNARKHSPEQIKQIARSIKSFGYNVPVLIDGAGNILAGAGR